MKTFDELTEDQQWQAIRYWISLALTDIIEGEIGKEEFGPEVYHKMQWAMEEANRMKTPWFRSEYLMDITGTYIREYALSNAKAGNVRYNDENIYVVDL